MVITNPAKEKILYDPQYHSYSGPKGEKYDSVTKLVAQCFEPFDQNKIAAKVAESRGVTKESVLKEWSDSASFGSRIHKYAEILTKGNKPSILKLGQKELIYRRHILNWLQKVQKKGKIIVTELPVFNTQFKVAGILDGIVDFSNNLVLIDWKTNKKFTTDGHWGCGIGPLSHLQDCHLVKYSLQLNLYKQLLLLGNYYSVKNYDMEIWHIDEVAGVVPYKALDLSAETELILKREVTQNG